MDRWMNGWLWWSKYIFVDELVPVSIDRIGLTNIDGTCRYDGKWGTLKPFHHNHCVSHIIRHNTTLLSYIYTLHFMTFLYSNFIIFKAGRYIKLNCLARSFILSVAHHRSFCLLFSHSHSAISFHSIHFGDCVCGGGGNDKPLSYMIKMYCHSTFNHRHYRTKDEMHMYELST